MNRKVNVTAHQNRVVICPLDPEKDLDNFWWPTGGSRLGCVLGDSQLQLGVSEEALKLMDQITRGIDSVGDLNWWKCNDGRYAFSWWGPLYRIINIPQCVSARSFQVYSDKCTIIPNDVPEKALWVIKNHPAHSLWQEPFSIE